MQTSPERFIHMGTAQLISYLDLQPHPQGGWFRQTWICGDDECPNGTAMYFLMASGERIGWHRKNVPEIWLFHAGSPLVLSASKTDVGPVTDHTLGADLAAGHIPQIALDPFEWQSARTIGDWTLCTLICVPGCGMESVEQAAPDFDIARD